MLRKIEGRRKKGTPNMRLIDSLKEAMGMSLQELSRPIADKTLWTSLILRGQGVRADSKHMSYTCFFMKGTVMEKMLSFHKRSFHYDTGKWTGPQVSRRMEARTNKSKMDQVLGKSREAGDYF